jgi:carboxymethylenebutenolidase
MPLSEGTNVISTPDGGRMPAFVALPTAGRGPGMVVLHEIFGVTEYVKRRARDLAGIGYIAMVPDLYWRLGSDVVIDETTQQGLQQGISYVMRLDEAQIVQDIVAALDLMRDAPETGGKAGVLGFCMGGRLAYKVAVEDAPDVVVSYYGSGIASQLQDAARVESPVLFQFGSADTFLPLEEAQQIEQAFSSHPNAEAHIHPGAGHAFDNPSPMFHHAQASADAWPLTTAFLLRQLPPSASA